MGHAQNASEAPFEHVQVLKVLAKAGNSALRQERAGVSCNRFRVPKSGHRDQNVRW